VRYLADHHISHRPERLASVLEKILPSVEADLQTGVIVVIEEGRIRIRPIPLP